MNRFRLLLPLLVLLLTLTGCTDTSSAPQPDEILTDHAGLNLESLSPEALAAALQTIDQTSTGQNVTVHVRQTLGDAMTLYVAYTAAFPAGTDLEGLAPGEVALSADGKTFSTSSQSSAWETLDEDETTLACVNSFGFDKEILKPGTEVTLTIAGFQRDGAPVFDATHTFTWTVENEGTVKYVDIKDDQGSMKGTCNFSAFAMNATLWDWQDHYDAPAAFLSSLQLLDETGQPIQTNASGGGGSTNARKQFRIPVNLADVAAVQVGPYVTEVPK